MLSVNPSLECVYSIESGPCERVDVFHVSDDWIGYNVSDWFMRDMTTKELIIMADPNRPRHYEEEFKRQIVQSCFASMFVRQVRQCFSAVWADGFPRCRHRFPVM